ncbi:MAG: CDP-glycerol glycerophosphotransferase family protein [Methanobacterium sp.]
MKKGKAMVFLEPGQAARTKLTVSVEKNIRSFEVKLFILPFLNKIKKNYDIDIFLQDSGTFKILSDSGFSCNLIGKDLLNPDQKELSKKKSIYIAQNWYKLDKNEELSFNGVNIGEATETETIDIVRTLFEKVQVFESIISKEEVDKIFFENSYSPDGKALGIICEGLGLESDSIYSFYGKTKRKVMDRVKYGGYYRNNIETINFYSIDNLNENSPNILFDTPYANHLDIVFPVMELLLKKGYNVYLLAKDEDINRYKSKHSFSKIKLPKIKCNKLNGTLKQYISRAESSKTFNYNGIDLWPLLRDDLYLSNKNKLNVLGHLKNFNDILNDIKPDLIVVGDDRGPSAVRADLLYAKHECVPIVEIQHGVYRIDKAMATPISNKIFVWGESTKPALLEAGASGDQMEVTGSPKYDSLVHKLKNHLKPADNDNIKTLLFATQPLPGNLNSRIINEISLMLEKTDNIKLIVKPHPSENTDYYKSITKQFSQKISVKDSGDNIIDLLLDADVLINLFSTVGLEAAILEKPMVCVNLYNQKIVYIESGVALEVKNLKDLKSKINDILYNDKIRDKLADNRKKFVYNYAYIQDGKASERICDAIIKMIED